MSRLLLHDSFSWPLKSVLPLVRRDNSLFPDVGLLIAGAGPVVFLTDLDQASPLHLLTCPRQPYPDFAAVARDWRVD